MTTYLNKAMIGLDPRATRAVHLSSVVRLRGQKSVEVVSREFDRCKRGGDVSGMIAASRRLLELEGALGHDFGADFDACKQGEMCPA